MIPFRPLAEREILRGPRSFLPTNRDRSFSRKSQLRTNFPRHIYEIAVAGSDATA